MDANQSAIIPKFRWTDCISRFCIAHLVQSVIPVFSSGNSAKHASYISGTFILTVPIMVVSLVAIHCMHWSGGQGCVKCTRRVAWYCGVSCKRKYHTRVKFTGEQFFPGLSYDCLRCLINVTHCFLLIRTRSTSDRQNRRRPRQHSYTWVINFKFPLQPHQKYNITRYGELGFS